MNPFEPLPGSAEESALATLPRTRAIWTMLLAQLLGGTLTTVLTIGSFGMCAVGYWVSPFLASFLWGMVLGRRHPGVAPRVGVVPGIVGGLAVSLMCAVGVAALIALATPDGSDPTVLFAVLAGVIPVWSMESVGGAIAGLALGTRR